MFDALTEMAPANEAYATYACYNCNARTVAAYQVAVVDAAF